MHPISRAEHLQTESVLELVFELIYDTTIIICKRVRQNSLQEFSVHLRTEVQSSPVLVGPVSSELDQTVTDPASFSMESIHTQSTIGHAWIHGWMDG